MTKAPKDRLKSRRVAARRAKPDEVAKGQDSWSAEAIEQFQALVPKIVAALRGPQQDSEFFEQKMLEALKDRDEALRKLDELSRPSPGLIQAAEMHEKYAAEIKRRLADEPEKMSVLSHTKKTTLLKMHTSAAKRFRAIAMSEDRDAVPGDSIRTGWVPKPGSGR